MSFDAWLTLGLTALVFIALCFELAQADVLFVFTAAVLVAAGVLSPDDALAGFSNPAVITVAALFVVAAGLRETGLLDYLGRWVLGKAKTERQALGRLSLIVVPLSGFLNNTPIVAMFMPIVLQWSRRHQVSPSKLLMPLSFLTILGGTCTLIGTSTNLVTQGLLIKNSMKPLGLFELSWIGVPYAIVGVVYLQTLGKRLLPERQDLLEQLGESRREYLTELEVTSGCRLVGQSIDSAGLRHLPGLFLIDILRSGEAIGPVDPSTLIEAGDRLTFAGIVGSIVELEKIPGLQAVGDSEPAGTRTKNAPREMCEAVISASSPLVGKTIRDADFRAVYGAAVLAVHRSGSRIAAKVGDITLYPGDTLLMQVRPSFARSHRNDPAFVLISDVPEGRQLKTDRVWIAVLLFATLLLMMTTEPIPIAIAGTLIAAAMVFTGCISAADARQSIEWQVLITIGASFALGAALQQTGAAKAIADNMVNLVGGWGAIGAVAGIYLLASLVTELITNNAVVVLLFPICVETAKIYGIDSRPLLIALTMAASASFMTPIGYQTNMMVYGPGGYRFTDYLRVGGPLNFLLMPIAVLLIYWFWM
jgi:di/tricarboxylate transporter